MSYDENQTRKRQCADAQVSDSRCYKFVRHSDMIVTCDCCKVRKDISTEMCIDCALQPECQVEWCQTKDDAEYVINICESCSDDAAEKNWFIRCKEHSDDDMPHFDDAYPCDKCGEYDAKYKPCDACGETRAADFHGCLECMFTTECLHAKCRNDVSLCHSCKQGFEATEPYIICKDCTPSNKIVIKDNSFFKKNECACCQDCLPIAPNFFWQNACSFLIAQDPCKRCNKTFYLCNRSRCTKDWQPNFQHCSDTEDSDFD